MSYKFWNFHILLFILSVYGQKKCGHEIQHRGFANPKIAFGDLVKRQMSWPWMVSIGYDNSTGYNHLCGGALIDDRHVLTAAHCFDSGLEQRRLNLVLGTVDYTSYTGDRIDRSIKKVHIHDKYNKDHAYFDVAIIEMDIIVDLSNHVYPICIPETASEINNRMNTGGSLAGWGATEEFNGEPSTILKETRMNVFAQSHCNRSWDITSTALPAAASFVQKEIPELFQSNLLCAGSGGSAKACSGDSGSPLMVFDTSKNPPTWVHIGIVHGGVVCSNFYKNLKFPEIFTRTEDNEVLDFIKDIMGVDDYYDEHVPGQESQEDCDFYTLSHEDYEDCIKMKKPCSTIDGTACIFPFIFRGKQITNCLSTPPRRTRPWCPTKINSSTKIPVRSEWGYCNEECPIEGSEIERLPSSSTSSSTTIKETETKCAQKYRSVCTEKFQRICNPYQDNVCRQSSERKCSTLYRDNCYEAYRDVNEPLETEECNPFPIEKCEYHWNGFNKDGSARPNQGDWTWEPDPSKCTKCEYHWNAFNKDGSARPRGKWTWEPDPSKCTTDTVMKCETVIKTRTVKQAYEKCDKVPYQDCKDVPKQVCELVTKERCKNEPYQDCKDVPYNDCQE